MKQEIDRILITKIHETYHRFPYDNMPNKPIAKCFLSVSANKLTSISSHVYVFRRAAVFLIPDFVMRVIAGKFLVGSVIVCLQN